METQSLGQLIPISEIKASHNNPRKRFNENDLKDLAESIKEISAAYEYVSSVLDTSDFKDAYAWYGWAIREAFLAGISHANSYDPLSKINFKDLRAANIARDIEWGQGQTFGLSYRGNELAGEVGEACNVLKKLDRERMGLIGSRSTVEKAAEELADVIICADLAAMDLGIDLAAAVARKFNKTSENNGLKTMLHENQS